MQNHVAEAELARGRELRDLIITQSKFTDPETKANAIFIWNRAAEFFTKDLSSESENQLLKRLKMERDRTEVLMKIQAKKLREQIQRTQVYKNVLQRVQAMLSGKKF